MQESLGNIEYNSETTILPKLITRRNNIPALLKVNWLKQLSITINKILLDETTNQSEAIHSRLNKRFETNHPIENTEVKIQMKPGCYPIQLKAGSIPYHQQQDVKKN